MIRFYLCPGDEAAVAPAFDSYWTPNTEWKTLFYEQVPVTRYRMRTVRGGTSESKKAYVPSEYEFQTTGPLLLYQFVSDPLGLIKPCIAWGLMYAGYKDTPPPGKVLSGSDKQWRSYFVSQDGTTRRSVIPDSEYQTAAYMPTPLFTAGGSNFSTDLTAFGDDVGLFIPQQGDPSLSIFYPWAVEPTDRFVVEIGVIIGSSPIGPDYGVNLEMNGVESTPLDVNDLTKPGSSFLDLYFSDDMDSAGGSGYSKPLNPTRFGLHMQYPKLPVTGGQYGEEVLG